MVAKVLAKSEFKMLFDRLKAKFGTVIGPTLSERGVSFYGDLKIADNLLWELPKYSPKVHFLPHGESLLLIDSLEFKPVKVDNSTRAMFITPVDMMSLSVLDHLFLDKNMPDPFYKTRRKNTFYIVLKVPATQYMFEIETGGSISNLKEYDLYIEPLEDAYLISSGSIAGAEFLYQMNLKDADREIDYHIDIPDRITLRQLKAAQDEFKSPVWKEASERCLSCGSCTNICPTCGCYDVFDEPTIDGTSGERKRLWDGCQYKQFTKVAGGEIFRHDLEHRFKHRYYHKIKYYPDDYNILGCVGCGRCIQVCPANIDMVQIIKKFGPEEVKLDENGLYIPQKAEIIKITKETKDIWTFRLKTDMKYRPGQFVQISVPLVGEAPISICSYAEGYMDLNVRAVGRVTHALFKLKEGDLMHIRGPYGNGYYVNNFEQKNVIIIAGGTGVAPIKGVINYIAKYREKFGRVDLYFGFRTPYDVLFRDELFSAEWSEKFNVHLTVDRIEGCKDWSCDVGLITKLLDEKKPKVDPNTVAVVCGPPIMIKYVLPKLESYGFKDSQIWMSLERMMKCGVGKCGHCMIGGKYVCKDGPVFNYSVVKTLPEV